MDQLLTIDQVAAYLNVSERTIRRMVAARRIPCVRVGGQVRFLPEQLKRWLGKSEN